LNYPEEPYQSMSKEEEKNYLKNLIQDLENELKSIKNRLQELGEKNEEAP
jgi:uncharacterized protein YydD (DUF2326 family)